MTASNDLADWDAVTLSQAIARRRVSCVEVMGAFLARIRRLNPAVNAVVSLRGEDALMAEARERDAELARGSRRGALHGLPQAIKDLAAAKGLPNTQGSPIYADAVAEADAIMVERMRASGAVIVGKTNVPEFGLGSQTYNPVFGATRNAYDQSRTSGGSSGGAAVAVALGMLPMADGSDHAGSLRNPAAFNNIFGLRPTAGRVPTSAEELINPTLTVAGPIARAVPDLAMLLAVQAGYDPRVPLSARDDPAIFTRPLQTDIRGWRIGWLGDLDGHLAIEPEVLALCERGLAALGSLGAIVEPVVPDFPFETLFQNWITLRGFAFAAARRDIYLDKTTRAKMKPEAQWEVERGLSLSALEVDAAHKVRMAWYERCRQLFDRWHALVLPSASTFPFSIETPWPRTVAGREMDTYHRWMEVMIPFTMANLPAVSVPVGFGAEGLPMGMQIAGPAYDELRVLQLAQAYDAATGWVWKRPPPLAGYVSRPDA